MKLSCWCGNSRLVPWSGGYALCEECQTLVDASPRNDALFHVTDDGASLYDAAYWLEKMGSAYRAMGCDSLDDILLLHYRERAAHWVGHFIRHVPPCSRVYEMGCGMGTLTKWLQDLGYDAVASELSPSWREFLTRKLGIRVLPPEEAEAEGLDRKFDSVIMMDVLEHLPDPVGALRRAVSLMPPAGQVVLQLPMYPDGATYAELAQRNHPFMRMLLPGEHLFLYSRKALVRLLAECGLGSLTWYPPKFETDMFVFASASPSRPVSREEAEARLMADPRAITACAALKNAALLEKERLHAARAASEPGRARTSAAGKPLLPSPGAVKHLLYVRLDGIGDGILSACLLENLPRLFPNAAITVVCDKASAALYEHAPMVRGVVALDKNQLRDGQVMREALERIAALGADMIFNGVLSPAPFVCALLANTGLPVLTTETDTTSIPPELKELFGACASRVVPVRPGARMDLDRHGDLLEGLGIPAVALKPRMWLSDVDERAAGEYWRECGFPPEKTVALFAGGGVPQKSYFRYGEALGDLFAREGLHVAALGGQEDREVSKKNLAVFARHGVPVADFCGKGTIRGDAAFLRDCLLAVGADTASAHAACAMDVPLVVLVPGAYSTRFFPYADNTVAVYLPLDCYGCNWGCRYGKAHCIEGILPDTVRQAVERALAGRDAPRKTLFLQNPHTWPGKNGLPEWQSPADFIAEYKKRETGRLAVVLSKEGGGYRAARTVS